MQFAKKDSMLVPKTHQDPKGNSHDNSDEEEFNKVPLKFHSKFPNPIHSIKHKINAMIMK